ncbi:hypothetical protein TorRG33x02_081200 [Trema orientale]|uniref:Uncharacterized protein n=1 Tax=Trema orientale TaxID=63057 RepID=A0A2P5FEG8_TREOI|nr:hypothetical protein TorRG33x02_081200 [Trema orientale]
MSTSPKSTNHTHTGILTLDNNPRHQQRSLGSLFPTHLHLDSATKSTHSGSQPNLNNLTWLLNPFPSLPRTWPIRPEAPMFWFNTWCCDEILSSPHKFGTSDSHRLDSESDGGKSRKESKIWHHREWKELAKSPVEPPPLQSSGIENLHLEERYRHDGVVDY